MEFTEFFRRATGREGGVPYDYQRVVAVEGLPDVIDVPTGAGKTLTAVGSWLYRRRFHPDLDVRAATPRRLVYALPMRVLVESVTDEVTEMLRRLGLADEVQVLQLMGGSPRSNDINAWRVSLDRDAVVVGTVDQIVSRQLMRGYGVSRRTYPIDFALVTNGAHVVVDEIQLAGQATSTVRQIAAFQAERDNGTARFPTAETTGLTCMSATAEVAYLDTVDNPFPAEGCRIVRLTEADRHGPLAMRLTGTRRVNKLSVSGEREVAAEAVTAHRSGTLTLVVVNRVDEAVGIYRDVVKQVASMGDSAPRVQLVHSRFRGRERAALNVSLRRLTGEKGRAAMEGTPGVIIVATQAVEAGVDIDAATLITEVAPWASVCQRAGRCNRAGLFGSGEDTTACLLWFDAVKPGPYDKDDLTAAGDALSAMEGRVVTSEDLLGAAVATKPDLLTVLRAPTMRQLFDTSPDLAGGDIDVSRYVRPDEDADIQVAWIDPSAVESVPSAQWEVPLVRPDAEWRVSVPLGALRKLLNRNDHPRAWVWDRFTDRWVRATARSDFRPQDLVLLDRGAGGYDEETGYDHTIKKAVATIDADPGDSDGENRDGESEADSPTDAGADEAGSDLGSITDDWQRLDEHLGRARAEAQRVVEALGIGRVAFDDGVAAAVVAAVFTHDLGKAFPGWQKGLRQIGTDSDGRRVFGEKPPEGLLAKAPGRRDDPAEPGGTSKARAGRRRLTVDAEPLDEAGGGSTRAPMRAQSRRRQFRHELVSVLYLRSAEGRELLGRLGVPADRFPLVDYLVGAHHGVLRVTPRDPVSDGRDGASLLGVVHREWLPGIDLGELSLPGVPADLSVFAGGGDSWGLAVADLLEEFGPFRLAYLETVVRMSDWLASGSDPFGGRSSS